MCCSVLQCVAVCCSVLQFVTKCCGVHLCTYMRLVSALQFVAVCCSVLQCVAVCCSAMTHVCVAVCGSVLQVFAGNIFSMQSHSSWQCVAVRESVLQCLYRKYLVIVSMQSHGSPLVCGSVLQFVAVCCSL